MGLLHSFNLRDKRMIKAHIAITISILLLFISSCATFKTQGSEKLQTDLTEQTDSNLLYSLYLIGDAGEITPGSQSNLSNLSLKSKENTAPSSIVFLGDNIYPLGLPDKESEEDRKRAETKLNHQIDALDGYEGEIYFIPGNHDWKKGKAGGLKALARQEKYIENYPRKNLHFEPDKGCPGPEVVELTDDLSLIIIDSQWWLHNWDRDKNINQNCEVQSRPEFLIAFEEALKDNKEKQVIVAMHHPLYSYGEHGGYFRAKDHLFPMTVLSHRLYIPLPVLGSFYLGLRGNYGNIQDINHPKYYELKRGLLDRAAIYPNVIFVAGHEHNLQYIKKRGQHFMVTGSGSKITALGNGKDLLYGHAMQGFMQLDFYPKGKTILKVWEITNSSSPFLTYQKVIIEEAEDLLAQDIIEAYDSIPLNFSTRISNAYERGGVYRFLFGDHYRDLYGMDLSVPVLNLEEGLDGLIPVKKGGGFQTNSLRLETQDGREYVLRSLDKDATRLLPEVFQSTFAADILQDQFTASHPFAAFVIPSMANAAGLYHTNPRLVYLPGQSRLSSYNKDFKDALYLFEERPDGDWSDNISFGNSPEVMSTGDVIEAVTTEYDHRVDQPFTLRSRLFDMFIGDWDRHDDQWRWASLEPVDGKGKIYRPIPRDRDQALSNYDGLIVILANWYTPNLRKMSTFSGDIKRIKWFNFNARYFDRHFLNQMTQDDWINGARELQLALTDSVILHSLKSWPAEVYAAEGDRIFTLLKQRRDNLVDFATRYYQELAKTVDIPGTVARDYFKVTWLENGNIQVSVYDQSKKGEADELYYSREIRSNETTEVNLYAMDGDDILHFSGTGKSRISVNVLGGADKDQFEESNFLRKKRLGIQDKNSIDRLPPSLHKYYREVHDDKDNEYDRKAFAYDYAIPLIAVAANPDDGFLLGGGVEWTKHAFQKEPYASRHSILGQFAFSSEAFKLAYTGRWNEVLGKVDFNLGVLFQGPTYIQNFFGFGNDTDANFENNDIDFFRVKIRNYALYPSLIRRIDDNGQLELNGSLEAIRVDKTPGRFIQSPTSGVSEEVFDNQYFTGLGLTFKYRFYDNPLLTRRGINFNLNLGAESELETGDLHTWFSPSLSFNYQFKYLMQPVIATRIGAEFHGGEFDFFQGAILGGADKMRGLRKERFTGSSMFYHNTDLRFQVFRFKSYYLPSMVGLLLSFDHGRVWYQEENSDTWHYSYGGGIWMSPFQTLLFTLNYHVSDVDDRFTFGMGFFF